MFCTKCGKAVTDGDRFCAACGAPVATMPSASAETRVQSPAPSPPSAAAATPAPAATAATERPGGVSLLAFWQFANAALLAMSTLSFVSFLFMKPGVTVTPAMAAVFGGATLVVFAALASGVGLMGMRPYGRALLLPFAWFSLILFPIGTVIGVLALRYLYKPEVRAAFAAKTAGWPAGVSGGFAALALGTAAFVGMTAMREPVPPVSEPVVEQINDTLEIGIMADTGDHLLPSPNNLYAFDVEDIGVVSSPYGGMEINLVFTPEGAAKMERLSGANVGRQMGFLINGRIDSVNAMTIQSPVSSRASLMFADPDAARRFAAAMERRP